MGGCGWWQTVVHIQQMGKTYRPTTQPRDIFLKKVKRNLFWTAYCSCRLVYVCHYQRSIDNDLIVGSTYLLHVVAMQRSKYIMCYFQVCVNTEKQNRTLHVSALQTVCCQINVVPIYIYIYQLIQSALVLQPLRER